MARGGPDLLDSSALIALVLAEHEHHAAAMRWMHDVRHVAICPIVEGALARTLVRLGESPVAVAAVLRLFRDRPGTAFWPDALSYRDVDLAAVRGHRQVTDAYLVALARSHGARLATLDQALVRAYPQHAVLIADR